MYRIIVSLILLSVSMPVFATRTVVTQTPYNNYYYAPQAYYGGDYIPNRRFARGHNSVFADINDLERYAMNRNFTRDSDLVRLERLENLAFGAVQEGDIYTRYDNVRNAILTRPKQNYKKSVLRNIADYFSGELTGFTPSTSDSFFGQSSQSSYSSPWGNGYKINNYGYGGGSGITLLNN